VLLFQPCCQKYFSCLTRQPAFIVKHIGVPLAQLPALQAIGIDGT
jgi:hypothetical protein